MLAPLNVYIYTVMSNGVTVGTALHVKQCITQTCSIKHYRLMSAAAAEGTDSTDGRGSTNGNILQVEASFEAFEQ